MEPAVQITPSVYDLSPQQSLLAGDVARAAAEPPSEGGIRTVLAEAAAVQNAITAEQRQKSQSSK